MKKRNLFFIPFILGIGIGFNSCNVGDGGNTATFPNAPAVVGFNFDMGGTIIGTPYGYAAAPSLISSDEGDCLYIYEFTLDYDNQPSDKYFTATNIQKEDVDYSYLEQSPSIDLREYTLPISNLDGATDVHFQGKFFILATCKDKNPNFRMVYNTEEEETDGIKNLYILARPSSSTPNSTDVSSLYAFDLFSLIDACNQDTTYTSPITKETFKNCKYIKANLKYLSKISDTGEPEFANVNEPNKPFEIYMPNNLQGW